MPAPRLQLNGEHPEPHKIARALEVLRAGEVIAYPTDTSYALGCDAMQKKAVERVYEIKGMRKDQRLALICPDLSDIARYASVDNWHYRIMRRLLPGPYTFILSASREVPRILQSKQKTVGLRVPNHPVPLALCRGLGNPLVTTTAALDHEPLSDPEDIKEAFGGLALILDVGYGGIVPSTVIDLSGREAVLVREGAGPVDDLFVEADG